MDGWDEQQSCSDSPVSQSTLRRFSSVSGSPETHSGVSGSCERDSKNRRPQLRAMIGGKRP